MTKANIRMFPKDPTCYTKGEVRAALTTLKGDRKLLSKPEAWTKGAFDDGHGAYCLIGANHKVAYLQGKVDGPGEVLAAEIMCYKLDGLLINDYGGEVTAEADILIVTSWNDAKNRTHKQILKFLDRCIAFCQKKLAAA